MGFVMTETSKVSVKFGKLSTSASLYYNLGSVPQIKQLRQKKDFWERNENLIYFHSNEYVNFL